MSKKDRKTPAVVAAPEPAPVPWVEPVPVEHWIRLERKGPGLAVLELTTVGDKVMGRRIRKEHDVAEVSMGRAHQFLLQDADPTREWSEKA
jgi:hypothetical protein